MENKSGSKSNLNESVLPLLEDEANKEKIELKDHSSTSKDSSETDDSDEKNIEAASGGDAEAKKKKQEEEKERKRQKKLQEEERKKQAKLEKQKKKEEEKQLKEQKKAEKKAAMEAAKGTNGQVSGFGTGRIGTRLNQFTTGINLLDRDEKCINEHVNVSFEDVIGEPDATQGFELAYRLSFGMFQFVRFWIYRILMAIVAIPLALVWALVFALLSIVSVWIVTPGFRVMDIMFYFIHRLWNCIIRTFLDPIFSSIALLRRPDTKPIHPTPVATCSGRSSVYKDGVKYSKVSSNETVETYKTSNDQDLSPDVTVTIDN